MKDGSYFISDEYGPNVYKFDSKGVLVSTLPSPAALQAALAQIASNTIDQCTIALDPPPADPTQVYLFVTDSQDPKPVLVPEVASGDGWSISADGKTATLLGAVCDKAKAGGYTSIEFVYGCPTPATPH